MAAKAYRNNIYRYAQTQARKQRQSWESERESLVQALTPINMQTYVTQAHTCTCVASTAIDCTSAVQQACTRRIQVRLRRSKHSASICDVTDKLHSKNH